MGIYSFSGSSFSRRSRMRPAIMPHLTTPKMAPKRWLMKPATGTLSNTLVRMVANRPKTRGVARVIFSRPSRR